VSLAPARIRVDGLALRRGRRLLVSDLAFTLEPGAGLSVHGPNGSGKSTLLRALAGLHEPNAGTTRFEQGGQEVEAAAVVAYLGHLDAIKAGQSVADQLGFWAALFNAQSHLPHEAASRLGLTRQLVLPGAVLSAGQRRRLALCRLLLANRPVWLLDEPAAPLDSEGRALLGTLLDAHRAAGGIVVAAAHDTLPGMPTERLDIVAPAPAHAVDEAWL
jgi:heme exporter protein A